MLFYLPRGWGNPQHREEGWLAALTGVPDGERRLDRNVVEETAFWRRAQDLISQAAVR